MTPDPQFPMRYRDPVTGQQFLIIPDSQPLPTHPQQVWVQLPMPLPPEQPLSSDPVSGTPTTRSVSRQRTERRRAARKGNLAGKAFLWFVVSWVPCGFDAPGLTLLLWGIGVAYLLNRAVRAA